MPRYLQRHRPHHPRRATYEFAYVEAAPTPASISPFAVQLLGAPNGYLRMSLGQLAYSLVHNVIALLLHGQPFP